ncbi:MAG TPA: hypothetical protein VM677_19600 [Actinokineospora sp.]|jgi:hypothetical protein|nr:hypothetical protein [Actinokineospora sp.]
MNDGSGRLSGSDFELLCALLRRYCEFDLDQYGHWVMDTAHGDVFIGITCQLPPGHPPEAYTRLRRSGFLPK